MDVTQRQIIKAGFADLTVGNGAVGTVFLGGIAVEHSNVVGLIALGMEAVQQAGAIHGVVACAVDAAVKGGQGNAFNGCLGENMYIFRPDFRLVGAGGGAEIVVAGGDEHGHGHFLQCICHDPEAFPGVCSVEQVTGQQHKVALLRPAQQCKFSRNTQQRSAKLGGLLRRAAHEGGI